VSKALALMALLLSALCTHYYVVFVATVRRHGNSVVVAAVCRRGNRVSSR